MPRRPNVVLVITDQQRADTMPGESPVEAHTPHLAWLTERSAVFRNGFCATPICTPARGSILTGLSPQATGVVANYDLDPLTLSVPDDVQLVADYLRPSGYRCAYTGKWHLPTEDDRRGFRDFVTRLTQWDVASPESDDAVRFGRRVGKELGASYATYLQRGLGKDPTGGGATKLPLAFHPSTLQAQQAASFIRRAGQEEASFLLVYSCIEPHPLGMVFNISPCPFDRMYDPARMPLPATRRDPKAPLIARRRNYRGLKPTDDYTDDELRAMVAGYYGAVSYVDHLTGILLEALIETDQFDDTLFIFTSDHGEMLGDHRMLKKGPVMFEELIRVPFLIKPPTPSSTGRDVPHLASHLDLVPTILDYCGAPARDDLHGRDLRGLIEGDDTPVRQGAVVEYHSAHWGHPPTPLRCWRTSDWKYVETQGGDDELYDLRADPAETRNLANDPAAGKTLQRMRGELREELDRCGDPWPEIAVPEHAMPAKVGPWEDLAQGL